MIGLHGPVDECQYCTDERVRYTDAARCRLYRELAGLDAAVQRDAVERSRLYVPRPPRSTHGGDSEQERIKEETR